jgi:hypothetical protein
MFQTETHNSKTICENIHKWLESMQILAAPYQKKFSDINDYYYFFPWFPTW